jgi:hypothetical protein
MTAEKSDLAPPDPVSGHLLDPLQQIRTLAQRSNGAANLATIKSLALKRDCQCPSDWRN